VKLLEDDRPGTFHAAGEPSTFDAMIATCAALGSGEQVRVPVDVLEAHGVQLGVDLPLMWGPEAAKLLGFECAESVAAGLTRRPLRESAADTLAWLLSLSDERPIGKFGRDKEEAILATVLA
jgi:2'-hydroxyisoflavone reductase